MTNSSDSLVLSLRNVKLYEDVDIQSQEEGEEQHGELEELEEASLQNRKTEQTTGCLRVSRHLWFENQLGERISICICTPQLELIQCNDSFIEKTGYSIEILRRIHLPKLLCHSLSEVVESLGDIRSIIKCALTRKVSESFIVPCFTSIISRDGIIKHQQGCIRVLFDSSEHPFVILSFQMVLFEEKLNEEQIKQLKKYVGKLNITEKRKHEKKAQLIQSCKFEEIEEIEEMRQHPISTPPLISSFSPSLTLTSPLSQSSFLNFDLQPQMIEPIFETTKDHEKEFFDPTNEREEKTKKKKKKELKFKFYPGPAVKRKPRKKKSNNTVNNLFSSRSKTKGLRFMNFKEDPRMKLLK